MFDKLNHQESKDVTAQLDTLRQGMNKINGEDIVKVLPTEKTCHKNNEPLLVVSCLV
jgi:hypothetical protein